METPHTPIHLDTLPPEILLHIFRYVADLGTPQTLLNLTAVCRTFHSLLVPSHIATDKIVWKSAIHAFLGAAAPCTLLDDRTYQSFCRRMIQLHRPASTAPNTPPTSFRRTKPSDNFFTSSHGPSPPKTAQKLLRLSYKNSRNPAYPTHKILTCPLPSLLPGTERQYDFLHTCTEAARPLEGHCYMSTAPRSATFIFGEDPRTPWYHSLPYLFGRGTLNSGAGYPLAALPIGATRRNFESSEQYLLWARQSLHSDPDLILHPGQTYTQVVSVTNTTNHNTWNLHALSLSPPETPATPDSDTIYEFRSCGEYLTFCEDPGAQPESPPLLSCLHTSGKHWTTRLGSEQQSGYTHENDGLRMNTSLIAIASRRCHTLHETRAHMKEAVEILVARQGPRRM